LILFFFIGCTSCLAQDYGLKIHFIDIGEGDAICIQTQDKNVLIDTGNLLSGYKLVDYLKKNQIKTINHLIITHPDLDHLSGVFFAIPAFEIGNFYDNGILLNTDDSAIFSWYEKIFRNQKNYRVLKENDVLKLNGVTLEVIWPADGLLSGSFNHNSLVIILSYKNFRCLLTGDIDKNTEAELLKKKIDLHADLLKVAHHGAADATGGDFLARVSPKIAVISVDKNNQRSYPAENTLTLLKTKNIKTYRTDHDGSLVITVNNQGGYSIEAKR
jgi:competence protein ComEC